KDKKTSSTALTVTPKAPQKPNMAWPAHQIPVEVYISIAKYLSREDICDLRLVNREFSIKFQDALFHSAVVPFNASVFSSPVSNGAEVKDSKEEGVDLFEKLGGSIYKFGMTFELDEGMF